MKRHDASRDASDTSRAAADQQLAAVAVALQAVGERGGDLECWGGYCGPAGGRREREGAILSVGGGTAALQAVGEGARGAGMGGRGEGAVAAALQAVGGGVVHHERR